MFRLDSLESQGVSFTRSSARGFVGNIFGYCWGISCAASLAIAIYFKSTNFGTNVKRVRKKKHDSFCSGLLCVFVQKTLYQEWFETTSFFTMEVLQKYSRRKEGGRTSRQLTWESEPVSYEDDSMEHGRPQEVQTANVVRTPVLVANKRTRLQSRNVFSAPLNKERTQSNTRRRRIACQVRCLH
uniref:7TM_GPCR_Srx domain-containing protein n=1 Tax=Angiostrongylus cantonensis TaxID=6313 RepID=A0A0K0D8P2_ANGCA